MSKITHLLNGGMYFKKRGMTKDEMWKNYMTMVHTAEIKYGAEFKEVIAIMEELIREVRDKTFV